MLEEYDRVLVTGAAGFVGGHLLEALKPLCKEITVLDNSFSASSEGVLQGVKKVKADIRNKEQIAAFFKDVDLVFHIAGNSSGSTSVENPRFDFETNALGTFNILEAALQAGTKRFIYISSASVYGIPQAYPMNEQHPTRPFLPYGTSKLTGELYCSSFFSSYGLPCIMVRPFCVYGPRENPKVALVEVSRYLSWHLNRQPIQIIGDIDLKTRDFIYVKDLIQGLLLIADKADPGSIFNLGSGEEVSMRELVEIIGQVTEREPIIHQISSVTQDTYRLVADISKARSLGYAPSVTLAEGVKQVVAALGESPDLPGGTTIFQRGQFGEEAI
jgi:UDP-glucose 4-epimerase